MLMTSILAGVLVGDNDLTFALPGASGVVWLVWGFYVVTNRNHARDRLAELQRSCTPGPSVVGGVSALAIGAVFIGLALWAILGDVP